MLDYLRKSSGSWIAKILFGLLVLSFGVWGVGDVVRSRVDHVAAIKVGDLEYSAPYVRSQFERQVNQFRAIFGPEFTLEAAKNMGLLDSTVRGIIEGAALDMAAKSTGMVASEEGVRAHITAQKDFQTADGRFDRDMFRRVLESNGMNEAQYIARLRSDLVRQRLSIAIAANGSAPSVLTDALYRFQNEKRNAEILRLPAKSLTPDTTPDEGALKQLYEERAEQFTAPELRTFSVLLLTLADAEKKVSLSDKDLEDYFKANRDLFMTPELRTVSQVIVESEEKAWSVAEKARSGKTLAEAAQEVGAPAPIDLGKIGTETLPPQATEAVFALANEGISDPVQTELGWHIFFVQSVEEPKDRPFEDVKGEVRAALAHDKAADAINRASAEIEDAIAAGSSLEDIAKNHGATILTASDVTVDAKPTAFPEAEAQAIVAAGFALQEGQVSRLEESGESSFVVRADKVVPPALRPFEEVQAAVKDLWMTRARQEKAEKIAQDIAAKVNGQPLESVAKTVGGTVTQVEGIGRNGRPTDGKGQALGTPLASKLFSLHEGEAAWSAAPDGAVVLRLTKITPADPAADNAALQALSRQTASAIGGDLLTLTARAYANRFGATVNRSMIDQAM